MNIVIEPLLENVKNVDMFNALVIGVNYRKNLIGLLFAKEMLQSFHKL
jgi:hypothetical protein